MTIQTVVLRMEAQEKDKIEFKDYVNKYYLKNLRKAEYTPSEYLECLSEQYLGVTGKKEQYLLSKKGKSAAWTILNESDECVVQLAELTMEEAQSFEDFEREFVGMAIREVVKERVN